MLAGAAACALLAAAGYAALAVAVRLYPLDPSALAGGAYSSILTDRDGTPLRAYLAMDERWRIPVTIDEVSPWIVKAVIAAEDKRFYDHGGIDWVAVGRAMVGNLASGRIVSGASTIPMQAAMLGQPRSRTLGWKARQAFRALCLEARASKTRIMEIYLSNAPYGGNIAGVEAASRRYFGKPASKLTLPEAALLAGIPQSPERLRPDRHPEAAARRRNEVLRRMAASGMITEAEAARVSAMKTLVKIHEVETRAPHLSDLVHAMYPREVRIRTAASLPVQSKAEEIIAATVARLRPRGVTNSAMVVMRNSNGEVAALVGSADYGSIAAQGQVNGALAPRSPGSTLKPLLYAAAFDRGIALPGTVLPDVPMNFVGYKPENFDRTYSGIVSADKALAWSLNIPAIQLVRDLGLQRAAGILRDSGLDTLQRPAGDYGLSLAIGTCSVRAVDLAAAYATIARGGVYMPPRFMADSTSGTLGQPRRVFSEGACWFVAQALADSGLRRPENVDPQLAGMTGVAWKTGTSSGYRDAWTAAFDEHHTVVVWVGNFDGRPSSALLGAEAAAPAALAMIRHLRGTMPAGQRDRWPRRPAEIGNITVCAETGRPPSPDCPTTRTALALLKPDAHGRLEVLRPAECRVHRRLLVDAVTGEELCGRCMEGRSHEESVFACWPAPVQSWLSTVSSRNPARPRHFASCETGLGSGGPRIAAPQPSDEFIVTPDRDAAMQKIELRAIAAPPAETLYWFLNGELVESGALDSPVYIVPAEGRHTVRCVDDLGRADWVSFSVKNMVN